LYAVRVVPRLGGAAAARAPVGWGGGGKLARSGRGSPWGGGGVAASGQRAGGPEGVSNSGPVGHLWAPSRARRPGGEGESSCSSPFYCQQCGPRPGAGGLTGSERAGQWQVRPLMALAGARGSCAPSCRREGRARSRPPQAGHRFWFRERNRQCRWGTKQGPCRGDSRAGTQAGGRQRWMPAQRRPLLLTCPGTQDRSARVGAFIKKPPRGASHGSGLQASSRACRNALSSGRGCQEWAQGSARQHLTPAGHRGQGRACVGARPSEARFCSFIAPQRRACLTL
jgi:hypothetical protein